MKQHTFSKDSWHFWLANIGTTRVYEWEELDICSYIRTVIYGAITLGAATLAVIGIVTFFGYGFITLGMWFAECISTGVWVLPNPIAGMVLIGMILTAFGFLIFGIRILLDKAIDRYVDYTIEQRHPQLASKEEPSFIALAYSKFKNKTCFRIIFK
jgi:hypothetical protein